MDQSLLAPYQGSRVLITGGAGYIGSNLLRKLAGVDCHITLLMREGRHFDLDGSVAARVTTASGDLTAAATWRKALPGMGHVFHLAAQTSAYVAGEEPFTDLEANVVPVLRMLEVCREDGMRPQVLFAGTATEVGITSTTPVDESFADHPATIYDVHKLAAEKYLQYYSETIGIETATLRLPNIYGPGPASSRPDRGLLNQMVLRGLRGETLSIYGDGEFVRDYLFIDDVVSAFLRAGSRMGLLSGDYYVLGSGIETRFVDAVNLVADRVAQRTGQRPPVVYVEPPDSLLPIEKRNFVANPAKFASATGWAPQVSLQEGIDLTIDHFMKNTKEPQEAGKWIS